MLNPGSCGEAETIKNGKDVPVSPDATIFRIIKLMKNCSLEWVRVINLSDRREKISSIFFSENSSELLQLPSHSIFHPSRANELSLLLPSETPVIIAWGLDQRKEKLANRALQILQERGHPFINGDKPFIHPLARAGAKIPIWSKHVSELYEQFAAANTAEHR